MCSSGQLRRAGVADARQLLVDGQHRAHGRRDRLGADQDILLTGRLVLADEALRAGLVSRVIDEDQLSQEAMTLADELATRKRSTVVATKAMLMRLRDHRRPAPGSADDILRECYGSNDFRNGVAAFLKTRSSK